MNFWNWESLDLPRLNLLKPGLVVAVIDGAEEKLRGFLSLSSTPLAMPLCAVIIQEQSLESAPAELVRLASGLPMNSSSILSAGRS